MLRRLLLTLALTLAVTPALSAQKTPAIPSNPSGQVLKAWLDAFNKGDSALPDLNVGREMGFRKQTGGFDLLSVEYSDAEQIQFTLRERNSPMVAFGVIVLPSAGKTALERFSLQGLGPDVKVTGVKVDAAQRKSAIEGAIAKLNEFYVFPDIAKKLGDSLTSRLRRGAYDKDSLGINFASRITVSWARSRTTSTCGSTSRQTFSSRSQPVLRPSSSRTRRSRAPSDAASRKRRYCRGTLDI
jgi:hypothetical protein